MKGGDAPKEGPLDPVLVAELERLVAALRADVIREDLPRSLHIQAIKVLGSAEIMLDEAKDGNRAALDEVVNGSLVENGKRYRDGLNQILPYWARGADTLDRLIGIVVPNDEAKTVTVHWERVPRDLRRAAASLANELVDSYYGRPTGGRPRKRKSRSKPGDLDM